MVTSQAWYLALLFAFVAERAFELWLSARNARWALAHGGRRIAETVS